MRFHRPMQLVFIDVYTSMNNQIRKKGNLSVRFRSDGNSNLCRCIVRYTIFTPLVHLALPGQPWQQWWRPLLASSPEVLTRNFLSRLLPGCTARLEPPCWSCHRIVIPALKHNADMPHTLPSSLTPFRHSTVSVVSLSLQLTLADMLTSI